MCVGGGGGGEEGGGGIRSLIRRRHELPVSETTMLRPVLSGCAPPNDFTILACKGWVRVRERSLFAGGDRRGGEGGRGYPRPPGISCRPCGVVQVGKEQQEEGYAIEEDKKTEERPEGRQGEGGEGGR